MRASDRQAEERYADRHGYFWLPCPRCGEYFGGHEESDPDGVQCCRNLTRRHVACCPKVSDDADLAACRRTHEEREELCRRCGLELGAEPCQGPPRLELVPWWRAVLDLLIGFRA